MWTMFHGPHLQRRDALACARITITTIADHISPASSLNPCEKRPKNGRLMIRRAIS